MFVSLIPNGNLFLLTNPLNNGDKEAEIESMFSFETRSVVLGGKTLSLASDFDENKHYGKDHFSNYVLANYETIDFSPSNYDIIFCPPGEIVSFERIISP